MNLPERFTERMQTILGGEYAAFCDCYGHERQQGLRVNIDKISVEEFLKITPFDLTPIPWTENGFFYREGEPVTRHPHYYAGLYYIQEPSAMVPAARLPVHPGERVLDLCAAPGGKTTELGARLHGEGLLVANDASVSRAKALLKNMERFGIVNAYVTGELPERLLEQFGAFFDKILVDAPCSGEGMFRKDPSLIKSWQERGPEYYAPLQREILSFAVGMLKPGGMLLYSTCTFSPEEDEQVIAWILKEYPELEMAKPEGYEGFAPGILESADANSRIINENCIRIWPHRMEGEGHFAALLRKRGRNEPTDQAAGRKNEGESGTKEKTGGTPPVKTGYPEVDAFLSVLKYAPLQRGSIRVNEDMVLLMPEGFPAPKLRYLRTGLMLGTWKKNRFEPSQALAMALRKEDFPNVLDLSADHEGIVRYLKGETLSIPETAQCASGWVLVCCDGYPLGWGKCVNGVIRNKYPPGWRLM